MSNESVLSGVSRFHFEVAGAIEYLKSLPSKCVDLVFGSPPYPFKGHRYDGLLKPRKFKADEWIEFMLAVAAESVRVCKGDVFFVVNNPVRKGSYIPAVEGLIWQWFSLGNRLDRPVIWHKNQAPNRLDYLSNDWEYITCFKSEGKRPYFNWESIATEPKYTSGGHFRQRDQNGERRQGGDYPKTKLARPRDVVRATVGGGHMGSKLSCENEAPFPESLVGKFVPVFSDPNGIVLDPFVGSGTVPKVALNLGRRALGCDIRKSQVDLTMRRMTEVESLKKTQLEFTQFMSN